MHSHSVTIEKHIFSLTEAELADYPHGIMQLDATGKILYYNEAEAALAHRTAANTVGLNFFTEVAPCTAVRDFQGRFEKFVMGTGAGCERFNFVFRFAWGEKEFGITMVRRVDLAHGIYIVVNSTKVIPGTCSS